MLIIHKLYIYNMQTIFFSDNRIATAFKEFFKIYICVFFTQLVNYLMYLR